MQDLFKKIVYTGVGLVTNTSETLRGSVDDLVNRGKISKEEGQSMLKGLQENMSDKYEEFESGITNVVGVVMDKMNVPTTESVKAMEKRIKSLEIKVGLLTKELETAKGGKTAATAKKKTTTTRRTRKKVEEAVETATKKATTAAKKTTAKARSTAKKATTTAKSTAKKASTTARSTAKKAATAIKDAVEG